ncbi:unnamed protein product [Lota lota]
MATVDLCSMVDVAARLSLAMQRVSPRFSTTMLPDSRPQISTLDSSPVRGGELLTWETSLSSAASAS